MDNEERRFTCFNIPLDKAIDGQVNDSGPGHTKNTRINQERGHERTTYQTAPPRKRKTTHDQIPSPKAKSNKSTAQKVKHESPWNTFEKIYECDLAGQAVVVAKKSRPNRLYFLRTFPGDDELDELLHRLLFTEHENIASTTDSFATTEGLFIIGDFMPLTLGHIVACRHYPDKEQLNAIMTQILNGLSYIETQGLQHASLDSSGILMDTNGHIKIGRLERCTARTKEKPHHTDMVGSIMMELLQNYTKDDGIVGIDNVDRWPSDSPPVTFLSSTTSASSLKSLMKHPLISEIPFRKETLIGLAWFAIHSTKTFWSYTS